MLKRRASLPGVVKVGAVHRRSNGPASTWFWLFTASSLAAGACGQSVRYEGAQAGRTSSSASGAGAGGTELVGEAGHATGAGAQGGTGGADPNAQGGTDLPEGGAGSGEEAGAGASPGSGAVGGTGNAEGGAGADAGDAGAGGTETTGPFVCPGYTPTCSRFEEWPVSSEDRFGSGLFTGGISLYGDGLTLDSTDTSRVHVTGNVSTLSGILLWFSACSDLSEFAGVTFRLAGEVPAPTDANTMLLAVGINSDLPWQTLANSQAQRGACTSSDPSNPWADCIAPSLAVPVQDSSQIVLWSQIEATGSGVPVRFDDNLGPREVVEIHWQFPWAFDSAPYEVDLVLDDLEFIGGSRRADCF
jgi:hypothetical protein